ncbi:hypothetical protein FQA39_LY05503 [Lamprigera yunnana]|nr:hypothetical protein FQA39_LY05503 [Lamprigera yunnana]
MGASAQFKNLFSSKMNNILRGESNFLNIDKQVMHKHKIKELISHSQILEQSPPEADLSIDDDQLQVIFDLQKCPLLISPITSPSPVERNEEYEYDLSEDIDMTDEAINALIRKDLLLENNEGSPCTAGQSDSKPNTIRPDMSPNIPSSVQYNSISAIINKCKCETNEPSINVDWDQIENTSNCNSDSNSLHNFKDADSNQILYKKELKHISCTEEGTVNTLSIIEDDNDSQETFSKDSTLLTELQSQHSMLTVNENYTGKSATLESIDTETNNKYNVDDLLTDTVQNCITIDSVVEHSQSNLQTMLDDKGIENPEIWSIPKTVKETKDVHVSLPHVFKSVLECESIDSAFCSNSSSDDELENMHPDTVTTIQSRNQLNQSNFVNELTLGFRGNTAFVIERFKYDEHGVRGTDTTSEYNIDGNELKNIVAKQLSSCKLCIGNNLLKRKQRICVHSNQTLNNDEKIKRRRMSQNSNTSDVNNLSQPEELHNNINVDPVNKIVENEDVNSAHSTLIDANTYSQSNKVHNNVNIISIHCINKISETKNNTNSASLISFDVNDPKGTDEAPNKVYNSSNKVFDTKNNFNMALDINSPSQSNEAHKNINNIMKAPCHLSLNKNISISNNSDKNIILNNNTLATLHELNPASHMPLDVQSHSQSKATLNLISAQHVNMTEVKDGCGGESYKNCTKKMTVFQGRKWITQMIQFCENNDFVFQVAKKFLNEPPNFVAELILERVSVDIYSAPVKSSYPSEPAMTVVQKGLHNFILALENLDYKDISKSFLHKADVYLRNINSPTKMEPILRLYVTICKGKSDYWKMRMALCSAFADMGDLAIPYMFTVLQTWVDVVPRKDMPAHNHIVMKAIVQIVLLKNVKMPGYNLCNLRSLLFNYYGFSDGEDYRVTFKNLIKCYIEEQNECARVLAMALTKYISINLVKEEIECLQLDISDNSTVDRICSVITLVIHFTKHLVEQLDVESRKNNLTWLKQFGEPSYPYAVREHTNCMLKWFVKYDSVPCNMLEKV